MAVAAASSSLLDLKPPPRGAHGEGITLVTYNAKGEIVTGGENKCVYVFKNFEDEEARTIEDHQGAVTAIAVKGNKLVTGCEDFVVRQFDLNKADSAFHSNITRFTAPVRAVALSPTGSACAAGGDEMTIKVVTLSDLQCVELRGHDGAIKSLCFDPQNEYLASASEDGFLRLWNVAAQKKVHEQAIMPEARSGSDPERHGMYGMDFDPTGDLLAVAVNNTVQVFDRNLAYKYKLKDLGHETTVSCVKYSPTGLYLASSSVDGTILVWEIASQQSMARFKHPRGACITSIAWDAAGEELAYGDMLGQLGVWRKPVRESDKAKPTPEQEAQVKKVEEAAKAAASVDALFDKEEDEDKPKLKLKRKPRAAALDSDDEDAGAGDGVISTAPMDDFIVDDMEGAAGVEGGVGVMQVFQQPPFQPSSTPLDQPRRFLVWNDVGLIMSREEETTSAVDVEFHDVAKHRPIRLVDHFGFTMGALAHHAFVLAAESHEPEGNDTRHHPSVLFCRNVGHWATDETWQILFPPGEEIEAVTVGGGETGFVAAATNLRFVRLYSMQGVAKHIFCIDGGIVSMAAYEARLMLAYHSGAGVNGDQLMTCTILDVDQQSKESQTIVPLSARATMTWLGFSETGMPAFADSEEIVRVLMPNWGSAVWTPVADLKLNRGDKNKSDRYWITGLTPTQLLAVICRGGETYPKVVPKPVVSSVPLRMPVVAFSDTVVAEEKYLRSKLNLEHVIATGALSELDAADREAILKQQRQLDQFVLASVSRAVQTQRPGRALDLCTMFAQPSSVELAIKLAVKGKMTTLAERMAIAQRALTVAHRQRLAAKARAARRGLMEATPVVSRGSYGDTTTTSDLSPVAETRTQRRLTQVTETAPPLDMDQAEEEVQAAAEAHAEKMAKTKAESPSKLKLLGRAKPEVIGSPVKNAKAAAPAPRPIMQNPFAKPSAPAAAPLKESTNEKHSKADKASTTVVTAKRPKAQEAEPSSTPAEAQPEAKKEKVKPAAAKVGITSAYMLWLKENSAELATEFPGLPTKELVKKAKEKWNGLGAEDKAAWKAKLAEMQGTTPSSAPAANEESQATEAPQTQASALETTQEVDMVPETQASAMESVPEPVAMES